MRALATFRGRLPIAFWLGAAGCGSVATSDSSELGLGDFALGSSGDSSANLPPADLSASPGPLDSAVADVAISSMPADSSLDDLAKRPPPDQARTLPDFWSWDASECDWSRCTTNFQGIYCMVTMPCDGIVLEAPDVASAQAVMAVAPDFTCFPILAGRYTCHAKNGYISSNLMWQICRITALPFFPIVRCVQA